MRTRSVLGFGALALVLCLQAWTQNDTAPVVERSFPYPQEVVRKGLEQVGGVSGGKLPMIDGFVPATFPQLERYERPYYQYRVQVSAVDANTTSVKVEARITAWYSDQDPSHSQYRSLISNGRLENDLLDRLQETLRGKSARPEAALPTGKIPPGSSSTPSTPAAQPVKPSLPAPKPPKVPANPQEQLDALLAERQAVKEKTAAAQAQIDELKGGKSAETVKFGSVKHSGVGVMSRQNFGGPVLFRAQAEDEFEVVSLESGWAQVKLADNATGYIQADELTLPPGLVEKPAVAATPPIAAPPKASDPDLGFWVSREDINTFSGDWARLKGKKVLFVYAQPRGLLSDIAGDDAKLSYAKRIFVSRYHSVTQSAQAVDGVVVVFLGTKGGVAAATLADIQQWVEGGLGDEAFVNRCSLDPPAEFRRIHLN